LIPRRRSNTAVKRYEIVRTKDPDSPPISLWYLADLGSADTEAFEHADHGQWEEYLQRVEVKPGNCILLGYRDGDVNAILAETAEWIDAVDELREWIGQLVNGDRYEIFWKLSASKIRRYSRDY